MSNTSLTLGNNWFPEEWPEFISVIHESDIVHGNFHQHRKYVPERTCNDVSGSCSDFECSECDCYRVNFSGNRYCPNCGARVVE